MLPCHDNYATTFDNYPAMLRYHKVLSKESNWHRCRVKDLHACLAVHNSDALLLIRDETVSAAHSGDDKDYSVLPMDELLTALEQKLEDRFPGFRFEGGYSDHSFTSGCWTFPGQKEDLLGTYAKPLAAHGKTAMATRLVPGIRFMTSDTGLASAKVSAMLMGTQHPISQSNSLR